MENGFSATRPGLGFCWPVNILTPSQNRRHHMARPGIKKIPGARKTSLPQFIAPQLATLVKEPPAGDSWLHELKFDGYRMLCRIDRGKVEFWSRNEKDWTQKFL